MARHEVELSQELQDTWCEHGVCPQYGHICQGKASPRHKCKIANSLLASFWSRDPVKRELYVREGGGSRKTSYPISQKDLGYENKLVGPSVHDPHEGVLIYSHSQIAETEQPLIEFPSVPIYYNIGVFTKGNRRKGASY